MPQELVPHAGAGKRTPRWAWKTSSTAEGKRESDLSGTYDRRERGRERLETSTDVGLQEAQTGQHLVMKKQGK